MTKATEVHARPVLLTVATVARRLGVAPSTLRTWDRRYGLGPSEHAPGRARRYAPADVARLELMQRLIGRGARPADAAARATAAEIPTDGGPRSAAAEADAADVVSRLADASSPGPTEADHAGVAGRRRRPGGPGAGLALPGADPQARGLARAALRLDTDAVDDLLDASLTRRGVVATWEDLLAPVLVALGHRWERTGDGIEVEHALSAAVAQALGRVRRHARRPRNVRPLLLACAPDDGHTLPLLVLSAALAEREVSARVLGARLPARSLADAVRRTGPAGVFVWAQLSDTADVQLLADVPRLEPPALVVAGGPGWPHDLPPWVRRSLSLRHAAQLLDDAAC